jgi:hypothetical protein
VSCGWNGKDGKVRENHLDHADQSEKEAAVLSASEAIALIFRQAADENEQTEAKKGVEEKNSTSSRS